MSNELFEKGLGVRKAVLGDAYVTAALEAADSLDQPLQQLVTEFCWGNVWSREGLSRRDRSLLNIGMLSALNRNHELKVHAKAALTNGVTKNEIVEIVIQVSIYCGFPAAIESMRIIKEGFSEIDCET